MNESVLGFRLAQQRVQSSRSSWLNAIRSVPTGPPVIHESGHVYFAQTGQSHSGATPVAPVVNDSATGFSERAN